MFRLFHGEERYLSHKLAQSEIASIRSSSSEIELVTIDASQSDEFEITQAYQSNMMFNNSRVIFIKRLYQNKKKERIIEHLIATLESLPEEISLIIWEDQKIPATTKYLKFFKNKKVAFESTKLNKRTFASWVKDFIKAEGIEINTDALTALSEHCNYEPERFANELVKLKLMGKSPITLLHVNENSPQTFENDIWQFVNNLNDPSGRDKAVKIVTNLLNHKVDPIFILAMVSRNFRNLLLVKSLDQQAVPSRDMASILKLPPFTVPQLITNARSYEFDKLKLLYNKIYNLEFEIKTGQIEPNLGLILLTHFI